MSEITVKCNFNGDIRRWSASMGNGSFGRITDKASELFTLDAKCILLRYVDNDGDLISIMGDCDLEEALSHGVSTPRGSMIRLEVSTTSEILAEPEEPEPEKPLQDDAALLDLLDDLEGLTSTAPSAVGSFSRMVHAASGVRLAMEGKTLPNGRMVLKGQGETKNLAIGPKGHVAHMGGEGPWAQFVLVPQPEAGSDTFVLASHGNRDKGWALAFDEAAGSFALAAPPAAPPAWRLIPGDGSRFVPAPPAEWHVAKCAAKEAKRQAKEAAKEHVKAAKQAAKEAAKEHLNAAKEAAKEHVKAAKEAAKGHMEAAKEVAKEAAKELQEAAKQREEEKWKKQMTLGELASVAPGRYKIRTAGHEASKQPAGWGLAAFRLSKEDGIRNGKSTFVSVHAGDRWPHEWDLAPGTEPGTFTIRTAGHEASKQPAGWGLAAFRFSKEDGIRNHASTFASVHAGDRWPHNWVLTKGRAAGTVRISTAGHEASKQPAGWGLSAFRFSKEDGIRNGSSTFVSVHAGDYWPSDWVLERMDAPPPPAALPAALPASQRSLATLVLCGNRDGREVGQGWHLAVHGSSPADAFDRNAFWALATAQPGKASLWCVERGGWVPEGLLSLSLAGNLDGREVAQGWTLMLSSAGKPPHRRDDNSAFVLVTRTMGDRKAGLWAAEPCEADPSKCALRYAGNRDGRRDGVGWYLAVHGSAPADARDGASMWVLLTKEAGKASLWDVRNFWGEVPTRRELDAAGNPKVGFHTAKKVAVPAAAQALSAFLGGAVDPKAAEPSEKSAAAAMHTLRVAAEWLKAKTGLPLALGELSNEEALAVMCRLRELPEKLPKWAVQRLGPIQGDGARRVDSLVAALGGGMQALWESRDPALPAPAEEPAPPAPPALRVEGIETTSTAAQVGAKLWKDREYAITALGEGLSGAMLFQGPHKAVPKGTEVAVTTDSPSTLFLAFEKDGRSGGFEASLQGWTACPPLGWGSSQLSVWSLAVEAGTTSLPATTTKKTVMSLMVAPRSSGRFALNHKWNAAFVAGGFVPDEHLAAKHLHEPVEVRSSEECFAPAWCGHGSRFAYDAAQDVWVETNLQTNKPAVWRRVRRAERTSASMQVIQVGSSKQSDEKAVPLPREGLVVLPTPCNAQHPGWKDRFEVKVDGSTLRVKRVDQSVGWGQHLKLLAMPADEVLLDCTYTAAEGKPVTQECRKLPEEEPKEEQKTAEEEPKEEQKTAEEEPKEEQKTAEEEPKEEQKTAEEEQKEEPKAETPAAAPANEVAAFLTSDPARASENFVPAAAGWGRHSVVEGLDGWVEYEFASDAARTVTVGARFNAADSRPLRLSLNGELQQEDFADGATGSWTDHDMLTWGESKQMKVLAGPNVLRLDSAGYFPHLMAIKITEVAPSADTTSAGELGVLPDAPTGNSTAEEPSEASSAELSRLLLMGFDPAASKLALEAANGQVEVAVGLLCTDGVPPPPYQ